MYCDSIAWSRRKQRASVSDVWFQVIRRMNSNLHVILLSSSVSLSFALPWSPCSVTNTLLLYRSSSPVAPAATRCNLPVVLFVGQHLIRPTSTLPVRPAATALSAGRSPFTGVSVAGKTDGSTDESRRTERQGSGDDQPRSATSAVQSPGYQQGAVISAATTTSSTLRSVDYAGGLQARTGSGRRTVQKEHSTASRRRRRRRRRLRRLVELGGLGSEQFETGTGTNITRWTNPGNCTNTTPAIGINYSHFSITFYKTLVV